MPVRGFLFDAAWRRAGGSAGLFLPLGRPGRSAACSILIESIRSIVDDFSKRFSKLRPSKHWIDFVPSFFERCHRNMKDSNANKMSRWLLRKIGRFHARLMLPRFNDVFVTSSSLALGPCGQQQAKGICLLCGNAPHVKTTINRMVWHGRRETFAA
jgi:hypothetical protein